MKFIRFWSLLLMVEMLVSTPDFLHAQISINEVCTYNGNVIVDEDNDESDWIELFNSGTVPVNLNNYALQDGNDNLWSFPSVTIPAQSFLFVYASGKNRTGPILHTNFKLSREGEKLTLRNNAGSVIDLLTIPELHLDHSFGKSFDGSSGTEGIFDLPTPGTPNSTSLAHSGYAPDPVFSAPAGFYSGTKIITITANGVIKFTTDGSTPVAASSIYNSPILVNQSTVLKARNFSNDPALLPSNFVTATYFINYETSLPVFSISTEPENFWDWNTGIYVSGPNASPVYPYYGSNFWQDWEIPAVIEFFDPLHNRQFSQLAGVKIHGGSSNRSKPMKSLRLSNKDKYGNDHFKYRFFKEKAIDEFKIIVLRNSSGDFNKTHFRDGALHQLMLGNANIDLIAYRPSVVFINGVYFGIQNIRERVGKYYLNENFNVDGDNIDLLEEDSLVIEGDFNTFNSMYTWITSQNLAQQQNFDVASQMFDTKSLCDYYIAETYLSNIDWPYNNLKLWRERIPSAKWRYILNDLDISLGNNGWAPAEFDVLGRIMGTYGDNNRHVHIFRSFLQNDDFREYFINRYADLVNTLFSAENLSAHILNKRQALAAEMPLHFNVWGNTMQGWDQEIFQVVMPYVYDRPAYAMEQVREVFDLEKITTAELDVWPPGAGTIRINTITPPTLPWKGNYFDGNPVSITVSPNVGYSFVRWGTSHDAISQPENKTIKLNPSTNNRYTAYFNTSGDISDLMVYPNPVVELLQFGSVFDNDGIGMLEIVSASGQIMMTEKIAVKRGLNRFEQNVHQLSSGVYMLKLITEEGIKQARIVKY